ncbi:MAG TPA: hypothetical protein VJS92_00725, partial [Candidatus Polarisedimenticolaceae bacterium]|nr:hypothetical protein [Candidatus Polarisedimenticolaceae bacterium]
ASAAPLEAMRQFYHDRLGLTVRAATDARLALAAGTTELTFVAAAGGGAPFYHFAFNIPENKLLAARAWQLERSALIPPPERLRDPAFPADVVHFAHWNAHSLFFFDPAGNVVEYIARHDLDNAAPGAFGSGDILYASEIGLIVDDVPAAAAALKPIVGVEQYRGGDDQFLALGDERGLLLVMKRGRILTLAAEPPKAAGVFPTLARVRGIRPADHVVPQFPYRIHVEA